MEINNQPVQGPRPNRGSKNDQPIDLTRLNREAIRKSTEEFQQAQYSADSLELSKEGHALAATPADEQAKADEARKAEAAQHAKVQDLRQKYLEGKLNTPEREDRAAHKMLATD